MMGKYKSVIKYLVAVTTAIALTACFYGKVISFELQSYKDILSVLLNISAVVFAVMGAWVAVIYPKALQALTHESKSVESTLKDVREDTYKLSNLIEIALISSLVLISILFFNIISPFLIGSDLVRELNWLRMFGFTAVLSLSFFQIISLFMIVKANIDMLDDLYKKHNLNWFKGRR